MDTVSARRITDARLAGEGAQVVTVEGGQGYRRRPCGGCPWRVDATGDWPAEAFAHSANTAEDMATKQFGCHDTGVDHPVTCAGFLLRGAEHNMGTRMALMGGRVDLDQVHDGGHELYDDYVAMAVANGLDPDDPCLRSARRSSYAMARDEEEWS